MADCLQGPLRTTHAMTVPSAPLSCLCLHAHSSCLMAEGSGASCWRPCTCAVPFVPACCLELPVCLFGVVTRMCVDSRCLLDLEEATAAGMCVAGVCLRACACFCTCMCEMGEASLAGVAFIRIAGMSAAARLVVIEATVQIWWHSCCDVPSIQHKGNYLFRNVPHARAAQHLKKPTCKLSCPTSWSTQDTRAAGGLGACRALSCCNTAGAMQQQEAPAAGGTETHKGMCVRHHQPKLCLPDSGTEPLHRLTDSETQQHIYTTQPAHRTICRHSQTNKHSNQVHAPH